MKIYTKTGDKGLTSLADGTRTPKNDPRLELYGALDEANSLIGAARSLGLPEPLDGDLKRVQNLIFDISADIAYPRDSEKKINVRRIGNADVEKIEKTIDEYDKRLEPLRHFILPGGGQAASLLHVARAVVRRGERIAVEALEKSLVSESVFVLLNRLSDYLFTAARLANRLEGVAEEPRGSV